MIVNDTLLSSPRQDPRFLYPATQKLNSNTQISDKRRGEEFHRLDTTNLEVKFEIFDTFNNFCPHPIPSHTTVNFKSLPHPFIASNLSLFVSGHPPYRLLHGSITFLSTLTLFKKHRPTFIFILMKSSYKHYLLFLFPLLKYFTLLILSVESSKTTPP